MKTFSKKITITLLAIITAFCAFIGIMFLSSPQIASAERSTQVLSEGDNLKGKIFTFSTDDGFANVRFFKDDAFAFEFAIGEYINELGIGLAVSGDEDGESNGASIVSGVNIETITFRYSPEKVFWFDDTFVVHDEIKNIDIEFNAEELIVGAFEGEVSYITQPKTIDDVELPEEFNDYNIEEPEVGDVIVDKYLLVVNNSEAYASLTISNVLVIMEPKSIHVPLPDEYSVEDWPTFEPVAQGDFWVIYHITPYELVVEDSGEEIDVSFRAGGTFDEITYQETEDGSAPYGTALYILSEPTAEPETPSDGPSDENNTGNQPSDDNKPNIDLDGVGEWVDEKADSIADWLNSTTGIAISGSTVIVLAVVIVVISVLRKKRR